MNLAQRIEKAMKLVVVPEDRHAKLWLNREGAEEIWRVLKDLYDRERESDVDGAKSNRVRIDGKMYAWTEKKVSVREPEEKSQTTALDRDGVYMIPYEIASLQSKRLRKFGRLDGRSIEKGGWYIIPGLAPYKMTYYSTGTEYRRHIRYGPIPESEALKLSLQATEAQEPATQEATF